MGERANASSSKYQRLYDNGTVAMITILIFNVFLLLGLATCAPRSDPMMTTRLRRDLIGPSGSIIWSTQSNDSQGKQYVIPYSSASTLPSEALQAGTTVHAIPSIDSSAGHHGPYHHDNQQRINVPSIEHSHRIRTGQRNFQSGFDPGQTQTVLNRVPQNNYETNDSPYQSQGNNQFRTKLSIGGNDKSQYFSNPSSYTLTPESSKTQLHTTPYPGSTGSFSTFPKFKSSLTHSRPTDSFGNLSKYRFPQATKYNSHFTSKHPNIPGNNVKVQPLGSQRNPEVHRYVKAFEKEPLIWNTTPDYQSNPSTLGLNYIHPKSHSSTVPTSFASNVRNYQPRVLPIQSSGSTPEIPQYQAASVDGLPINRYHKPADGYEQLANQPQFHFTTAETSNETIKDQPIVYHSNPFEQIRTDVELINKKKTTTPSPYESDEDDFGQVFKAAGDFGLSSARDDSFELPSSNLFDSYDKTFGKYSKLASLEQKNRHESAPSKDDETSKPVRQSIEEENENDEDKSSGEYRSSYTEEKSPNSSYEEEGEEESQRNEQHGSYEGNNDDDDDDSDDKTASYRSYGEDFEKEFEESYRKDLPKSDYVHVKEVPDIDESRSETKKHSINRPRAKTTSLKQQIRQESSVDYEEPKNYESRTIHDYSKPKNNYQDNEGHGSRASSKKIIDSRVEDSYGYKIPSNREAKISTKKNESDKTKRDQGTKKITNLSQRHSDKIAKLYSSTQIPLTSTVPSIGELQSYTFPPFDGWKPSKQLINDRDIYGATRQEIRAIFNSDNPDNRFYQAQPRGITYPSNGQTIRDLSGI